MARNRQQIFKDVNNYIIYFNEFTGGLQKV